MNSLFFFNIHVLPNWMFLIPFIILFIVFVYIFCVVIFFVYQKVYLNIFNALSYLTLYFLIFVASSFWIFFINFVDAYFLSFNFYLNSINIFLCLIVTGLLMFIFWLSLSYFTFNNIVALDHIIFLILSLFGMFIVILSNDLFVLFLGIELQSYCFYVLVAMRKYSNISIEASIKYFILGAFTSGLFLFGCSLLYGMAGTLNIVDLAVISNGFVHYDSTVLTVFFGMILLLASILFKLALAPFHFWLADIYEGTTILVVSFLSIVGKISFLIIFFKLYYILFSAWPLFFLHDVIIFLCIVSIGLSAIACLYEFKLKRLLAYSGISHTAFMVMALALGSFIGVEAFFVYFFTYLAVLLNLFYILVGFRLTRFGIDLEFVTDFSIIVRDNPLLALNLFLLFLSLAGIPPLPGFFGKALILKALVEMGYFNVAIIIILLSIVNAVFYVSFVEWFLCQPLWIDLRLY